MKAVINVVDTLSQIEEQIEFTEKEKLPSLRNSGPWGR